jgi:pilus assembly protein CpaE
MTMSIPILVVDDNEVTLKLVTATLQSGGFEIHTAQNAKEAIEKVGKIRPQMAILDVMMPDMDGYELCKKLRQIPVTAHIPIMMLTAFSEINEKLKAFDAGADDFMPKPFQPEELQARVKVHLRRTIAQTATGESSLSAKKIAVFSLRGGVGVSSLATNLAAGFVQLWQAPALLIDLALYNGQSALMLNLSLRNTWSDLGNIAPEDLDLENIQKTFLQHDCGLHVLASPKNIAETEKIKPEHVSKVLELAQSQYQYIVFDLPHDFTPTTLATLDEADTILLMLAPELASVRCAANALEIFDNLGYDPEKVHLVLNWTFANNGLARKEIENALQKNIKVVLPHIPDALISALMMGKPMVLNAEKASAGGLFEDLAYFWSKEEHKQETRKNPTPAYLAVQERIKKRAQAQKQKK